MNKYWKTTIVLLTLLATIAIIGCSSEAPETQKLYTDAKMMWDQVNRAFTLPKGQERTDLMNKAINEKWDMLIVSNLEAYVKAAPSGKFAKEANTLLEQARSSDKIRVLGQVRPYLEQGVIPKPSTETDTASNKQQGTTGGSQ